MARNPFIAYLSVKAYSNFIPFIPACIVWIFCTVLLGRIECVMTCSYLHSNTLLNNIVKERKKTHFAHGISLMPILPMNSHTEVVLSFLIPFVHHKIISRWKKAKEIFEEKNNILVRTRVNHFKTLLTKVLIQRLHSPLFYANLKNTKFKIIFRLILFWWIVLLWFSNYALIVFKETKEASRIMYLKCISSAYWWLDAYRKR